MKARWFLLWLSLAAFGGGALARATDPAPAAVEKIYVIIETFDPIKFHELRQSRVASGELVLSTLKATAATSAKLAGLNADLIVLDEDAKAPKGATVLRLTWADGNRPVKADLTENGRNTYLGVVSAQPLETHPEYARLHRAMALAPRPDDAHDAAVKATTEAYLYFALKWTADRRARAARRE